MEKLIEWYNMGEMVSLTITNGNIFSCTTLLDVDNLSFNGEYINIMSGDIDINIRADEFIEETNRIYYKDTEGCIEIELTI